MEDVQLEETVNSAKFAAGWPGLLQKMGAKLGSPYFSKFYEKTNLPRALEEASHKGARLLREEQGRAYGEGGQALLDDLVEWASEDPNRRQIAGKIVEAGGKTDTLTPGELAEYSSRKADIDRILFGGGGGLGGQRLIRELAQFAEGNLGENYFPWRFKSPEDQIRLARRAGPERLKELKASNFEMSRSAEVRPFDNTFESLRDYHSSSVDLRTKNKVANSAKAIAEQLRESGEPGASQAADAIENFHRHNILNERNGPDAEFAEFLKHAVHEGKVDVGDSFASSGRGAAPKGPARVARELPADDPKVKAAGEPMYELELNGRPYPEAFSKTDVLAMKYGPMMERAITPGKILDAAQGAASLFVIAGNIRSGIIAAVSNTARVVSNAPSPRYLARGITEGLKAFGELGEYYRTGKMTERLQRLSDSGYLNMTTEATSTINPAWIEQTKGALGKAKTLLYSNVTGPDLIAKFVAEPMMREYLRDNNPGWSVDKLTTEVNGAVAQITDMASDSARSPAAYDGYYRAAYFLSNSAVRETQLFWKQFTDLVKNKDVESATRLATNAGLRFGALYAIYKLAGQDDPKVAAEKSLMVVPFIGGLAQGRIELPQVKIVAQKGAAWGRLVDDALGGPVMGPLTPKERDQKGYQALPVSGQNIVDIARGKGRRMATTELPKELR